MSENLQLWPVERVPERPLHLTVAIIREGSEEIADPNLGDDVDVVDVGNRRPSQPLAASQRDLLWDPRTVVVTSATMTFAR